MARAGPKGLPFGPALAMRRSRRRHRRYLLQLQKLADFQKLPDPAHALRNQRQRSFLIDQLGLAAGVVDAIALDLAGAGGLDIPKPVDVRPVGQGDHETVGGWLSNHRSRVWSTGTTSEVPNNRVTAAPFPAGEREHQRIEQALVKAANAVEYLSLVKSYDQQEPHAGYREQNADSCRHAAEDTEHVQQQRPIGPRV